MIGGMKPTVYLDSSVPSYWLEQNPREPALYSRHLTTRRWWFEVLPKLEPVISQVVWLGVALSFVRHEFLVLPIHALVDR